MKPDLEILHLEDCSPDAELIARVLHGEWPRCSITHVTNADDYHQALAQHTFDIILSDYALPGFDGMMALEDARQQCPHTPFVFVSGMIGEERAVEALKRGATDYVSKDRPRRLVPAIRQAVALVSETSRRQQAEARLREQASLLDKARDAILATDLAHRVTYWNASAERLYGRSATEVLGRTLEQAGLRFDAPRLAAAREALHGLGEWRGELEVQIAPERSVLVERTWSLVSENGQPRSMLAIDTDVTERKKLEAQLFRAQRLESVGTLAGGVAHDLNNVFTPVLLALDLLAPRTVTPDERLVLEKTRASVAHGAALVRQLLAFARGGAGERHRLEIAPTLAGLQPLLRQSLPENVTLLVDDAAHAWPLLADETQFKQALINLALNARDAMPEGGRLRISAENVGVSAALAMANPGTDPGPFVRITVADTGTGMEPETARRVFDPFFTTKAPGKGTGLGLSVVTGILKGHGGFAQVESAPGEGTAFHLFFPAQPARAGAPGLARRPATAGRQKPPPSFASALPSGWPSDTRS